MAKLKRLRIWICVNFLGIWLWPSAKMDFVHITSYPIDPYEIAKLLKLSPWQYWCETEYAMWREDAIRLDSLGFSSEQTELGKAIFKASIGMMNDILENPHPVIWKANNFGLFDYDRFPNRFPPRY